MIKVDALTRTYPKVIAVDNVSFQIGPREIVGLLGHNGAGKTTILKILTGFLEPSKGKIEINGLDVGEHREQVQAEIGYLPENSPLYPEMTVMEYLDYAASLRGVSPSKKNERIIYAVKKTRIEEAAMKQIGTLSRGYKQRLGVAQAILNSPSILILDEPTNGLDPTQIIEMRSLIRELSEHSTIIISTHILQEVQALCSRVIIVNKGKLALDAPLDNLQSSNKISLLVDKKISDDVMAKFELKIVEHHAKNDKQSVVLESSHSSVADLVPELTKELVEHNYRVFSISPIIRDLETIFREITEGRLWQPHAAVQPSEAAVATLAKEASASEKS